MPATFLTAPSLVSLLDRDDPSHRLAQGLASLEFEVGSVLVTSNYAVLAASRELQRRYGLAGPRALAGELLPMMRVEWVGRRDHDLGLSALLAGSEPDTRTDIGPDLQARVDEHVALRLGVRPFMPAFCL
jgi:hypothetical protein